MEPVLFPLKEDLIIPQDSTRGVVFFKDGVKVGYRISMNPVQSTMTISLSLFSASDGSHIQDLASLNVTKEGRNGKLLNADEIADYEKALEGKRKALQELSKQINETSAQLNSSNDDQTRLQISEALESLNAEMRELNDELNELQQNAPQPEYEKIDTFDEVKTYFGEGGVITPEGLQWGLGLELSVGGQKIKIGDLIEIPSN